MNNPPPAILECAALDMFESLSEAVAETNTALLNDPKPSRPNWLDNAEEILLKMSDLAKKYQPARSVHPEPEDPKYPY
jgi:hypothetical protein